MYCQFQNCLRQLMTDRQETLWRLDAPSCAKHIDMTISHVYNAIEMDIAGPSPLIKSLSILIPRMNHTMASNGDIVGYLDTTYLTLDALSNSKIAMLWLDASPSNVDAQYKQVV
ncbi:unnamed protein product [Umbelopsis ramanniana]